MFNAEPTNIELAAVVVVMRMYRLRTTHLARKTDQLALAEGIVDRVLGGHFLRIALSPSLVVEVLATTIHSSPDTSSFANGSEVRHYVVQSVM